MSLVSGDYGAPSDEENSLEEMAEDQPIKETESSPDKKRSRGKLILLNINVNFVIEMAPFEHY
jgi:hypothetical protein